MREYGGLYLNNTHHTHPVLGIKSTRDHILGELPLPRPPRILYMGGRGFNYYQLIVVVVLLPYKSGGWWYSDRTGWAGRSLGHVKPVHGAYILAPHDSCMWRHSTSDLYHMITACHDISWPIQNTKKKKKIKHIHKLTGCDQNYRLLIKINPLEKLKFLKERVYIWINDFMAWYL